MSRKPFIQLLFVVRLLTHNMGYSWNRNFGNKKISHKGRKTQNYRYNFTSNSHDLHFFSFYKTPDRISRIEQHEPVMTSYASKCEFSMKLFQINYKILNKLQSIIFTHCYVKGGVYLNFISFTLQMINLKFALSIYHIKCIYGHFACYSSIWFFSLSVLCYWCYTLFF